MPRSGSVRAASDWSIHPRNTTPAATPMAVAATPTRTLSLMTTPITDRTGRPKARMVACSRWRSSTVIRVALNAIRSARISTATGGDHEEADELLERLVEHLAHAGHRLAGGHPVELEDLVLEVAPRRVLGGVRVHDVGESGQSEPFGLSEIAVHEVADRVAVDPGNDELGLGEG